jgi:hypothetical protein
LLDRTKGNPHLEIIRKGGLVRLKIWDVLIDLEIDLGEFKYSASLLEKFLQETTPSDSFAFALGFQNIKGSEATLASTKKEGFELITLKGYAHKVDLVGGSKT